MLTHITRNIPCLNGWSAFICQEIGEIRKDGKKKKERNLVRKKREVLTCESHDLSGRTKGIASMEYDVSLQNKIKYRYNITLST